MKNWKLIMMFSLIYISLFIMFFPKFLFILDDNSYLREAHFITLGKLCVDTPERAYNSFVFNGKCYAPANFPGYSFFLAPFTLLGWKLVFLSGLVLHLIGTLFFCKILRRIDQSTYYALLYLFFPPFIYFSTVLINNYLEAVLIMAAFYFYLGNKKSDSIVCGLLFGAASFTRYPAAIVFIVFAGAAFFRNRKKFIMMCAGFLPFAMLIALYNFHVFGSVLTTGYSAQEIGIRAEAAEPFSLIKYILIDLPFQSLSYALKLSVIYPLMLISIFFYKQKARAEIILGSLAMFLFYSVFTAFTKAPDLLRIDMQTLVFGTRYLLPIVPLLLLAYVPFLGSILKKMRLPQKSAVILGTISLIIIAVLILQTQAAITGRNLAVSNAIYANVPENSLIIGNEFSWLFLFEQIRPQDYLDKKQLSGHINNNTYMVYTASFINQEKSEEELQLIQTRFNTTKVYSAVFEARPWATSARPRIGLFIYKLNTP